MTSHDILSNGLINYILISQVVHTLFWENIKCQFSPTGSYCLDLPPFLYQYPAIISLSFPLYINFKPNYPSFTKLPRLLPPTTTVLENLHAYIYIYNYNLQMSKTIGKY